MTIKDLAAMTGYSVGTVSRALNDHPSVSQEARRVVLAAAKECGFQFNVNAKQLKQQRLNSILVIVKGNGNQLFSELFEAIQMELAKTKYPMLLDYIDEDGNEVLRAVQVCREKKPQGILFLGGNHRNFEEHLDRIDVPCVLVTDDASELAMEHLSSVSVDDRGASRAITQALIDQGHREFAVVGGDWTISDTSRLRFEGCLEAFRARGIDFDPDVGYRPGRYSYQAGYDATKAFLESGLHFTALIAAADVMAIGAIRALRERGLRVPEDVSVVGFDGLTLGSYLVPQLTTVRQPVDQMARRSVEILLDCVENGAPARHETVPYTVWNRESIRPNGD